MKFSHNINRLNRYIRTYGIFKTIQHLFEYLKLTFIQNKYVIFFYDLTEDNDEFDSLPDNITIESRKSKDELSLAELERLSSYGINEIIKYDIEERFNRGSNTLWLLKDRGEIAAFTWATTKLWERDRFFPYSPRDIFIFDGFTFPEYRGRQYISLLLKHMRKNLREEGFIRFFLHIHELNEASLRTTPRSGMQKFGTARKFRLFGYDVVIWSDMAGEK